MARILLVEDESLIAVALQLSLEQAGHEVAAAANGRRALDALNAGFMPDVIVTDYMMPVMDGPALIAAIRARPGLATVPILLMSAVPEERIAAAAGHDAYLTKPFQDTRLIEILRRLLDGRPRPRRR